MDAWLEFARGPLFRFAVLFMVLGLARHLILTILAIRRALAQAGDKDVPWKTLLKATLAWLFPVTKIGSRVVYSVLSMTFHVGLILVPLLLAGHIALWERGLGVSWPSLPAALADVLTLLTVVTALLLIAGRMWTSESRALTRSSDVALLVLLAIPFLSGFLVSHPLYNPFGANGTLLVHVLSSDLVLILMPITKLSHCVLLPTTQIVGDVGWRFPPDAGERVFAALHGEPQAEAAEAEATP